MDFKQLFLSTEGRIGRQRWWIGAIGLAVVNILVSLIVLPVIGLGGPNLTAMIAAQDDPAALSAALLSAMQSAAWGSLVLFLIFAYPGYCLSVKRRHDKDNDGRDVLVYFVVTAILMLIQALGMGYDVVEMNGIPVPTPTLLYSVVGIAVGIFGIYLLVVLGFLKGTEGDNSYGPDPLRS